MAVEGEDFERGVPHTTRASVGVAVVEAVAAETDRDPMECPPLYDVVDPDVLETLVSSGEDVRVEFEYAGCAVTIDAERVSVERR